MCALRAAPVHLETARRVLQRAPVMRFATSGPDGPHAVPLWFVWEAEGVFCSVFDDTVTLANVRRDSRVALVFDVGTAWEELAGVVLTGTARPLRPGHPDLRAPMSRWHDKYRERFARQGFRTFSEATHDLWFVRVIPQELAAWDHGAGPFAGSA